VGEGEYSGGRKAIRLFTEYKKTPFDLQAVSASNAVTLQRARIEKSTELAKRVAWESPTEAS
jgi:hypothetical protein